MDSTARFGTLPGEIRLYVCVGLIFLFGSFRGVVSALAAIAFVIYAAVNGLLPGFEVNDELVDPIILFGIGAGLSVTKKYVPMSLALTIIGLLVPWFFRASPAYHVAVYIGISYAALYLFSRQGIRRISLPGDYSYGVYLYGFPMQHVVAALFPRNPLNLGTLMAAALALGLAVISWHVVELPCNRLGVRIVAWCRARGSLISSLENKTIALPGTLAVLLVGVVAAIALITPTGRLLRRPRPPDFPSSTSGRATSFMAYPSMYSPTAPRRSGSLSRARSLGGPSW